METCASDISGECLVTDLVHELSSRLEIPLLLDDNLRAVNKEENVSPLDTAFYEEQIQETWGDDTYFSFVNNCDSTLSAKDDPKDDLHSFLETSNPIRTHPGNGFSGSRSGSGSDCSSTEIWMNKGELDTPPITPPDERITSENVYLLSSDELRFMPICKEGSPQEENKLENTFKNICKRVRIQPKPVSTTLNIFESKTLDFQTIMCNVFNDVNSVNQSSQDLILESKFFSNSSTDKKRALLSKKDLELLQAKRKQERMIRNRESAYLSRKRKKEHVANLEKQVQDLQIENKQLKVENLNLRQRLAKYEELCPLSEKKNGNLFTDSPRKTTALLALLFTVCLNIGSFSSLINEKKVFTNKNEIISENLVPNYGRELHSSRSLLWANNDFESLNSTYANLTRTSCPVSVNQTESIRLESELRRWIGGDEDSRQTKHNVSKISQYFLSGERPKQHKSVSRRQRFRKLNFQKKNLEVYQMNLLYFNTFFEAIHRRDDTFYLVSFSSDHLLLPALSHNQTSRPKMSLMLPASFSNVTGLDQVEMMQIDCEVTNTQLLSVNENDIPSVMKPYANLSNSKNNTDEKAKEFGEYFVNDLPITLVPSKKNNYNAKGNDLTYLASSGNRTEYHFESSPSSMKTNSSDSSELLNFPQTSFSELNFNRSFSKSNKEKNSPNLFNNKTSRVFFKEPEKQDDFVPSTKKNFLKLLMFGPTATDSVKFSSEKSFYKSFKNVTKFLLN